jgi:hypothetical protein
LGGQYFAAPLDKKLKWPDITAGRRLDAKLTVAAPTSTGIAPDNSDAGEIQANRGAYRAGRPSEPGGGAGFSTGCDPGAVIVNIF